MKILITAFLAFSVVLNPLHAADCLQQEGQNRKKSSPNTAGKGE